MKRPEASAEHVTSWELVKRLALATIGKKMPKGKEIERKWKLKLLISRHSPIRALQFVVTLHIPYWVAMHLARHKIGIEHYITTQRDDRTLAKVPRSQKQQGEPVDHTMMLNAEAILAISERRLCGEASTETQISWQAAKDEIKKIEPELAAMMNPPCVRQGVCPEWNDCGFISTPKGKRARQEYLDLIKETRA